MSDNTDLIKAYEYVAKREAFLPSDLADDLGFNMRYAREIIGVLMSKKLAILDTSNPDFDYYVAVTPSDPFEIRSYGMKKLGLKEDEVRQPKTPKEPKMASSTTTKTKDTSNYHPCNCGCGENVPPKSNYRPGHDARHAGVIGRAVAETGDTGLYKDLPTDALKAKAQGIAEKAVAKAGKREIKAGKSPSVKPSEVRESTHEEGTIKVGKTERAAKRDAKGNVVYMDDAGGWTPASKTAAKTFTV